MSPPPPRRWPFVGRHDELELLRTSIGDAEVDAVVVTGPPGAGKTRLAAEAASTSAVPAMWWHASEAVSGVPFGAIAELIDPDAPDAPSAFARVAQRAKDAGGVVVVDDAPHLDARSADLLARLVDSGKATVLATARAGVGVPQWMEWLWLGDRTVHVELGPLPLDDVAELVDLTLEGVDAERRRRTASSLLERTGGNPLFVRELLSDHAERVRRGHGAGEEIVLPAPLAQVLAARLESAGDQVVELLARVAVLGSLPLGVLENLGAERDLTEAEGAGYLVVERTTVRAAHPLYAEAALGAVPGAARRRLVDQTARTVLGQRQLGRTERLAAVSALVDHDLPVEAEELLAGARSAFAALDHALADRLATMAIDAGDGFEANLLAGAARSGLGRGAAAEQALRTALDAAADDHQRARAAGRLSVHLLNLGGRTADAAAVLDQVAATLNDADALAFLAADRAKVAAVRGEPTPHLTAPEPQGSDDELAALNQSIVVAYAQAMSGDAEGCRSTIRDALPLTDRHREVLPWSGQLLGLSGSLADLLDEGPTGALASASEGLRTALDRPGADTTAGTWRFLVGFHGVVAGHLAAAIAELAEAEESLASHDLIGARGIAIGARAWALAQSDQVDAARALLDDAVLLGDDDGRVRAQVAIADAWCDAAESGSGPHEPAPAPVADRLVTAAAQVADGGQGLSALLMLHEVVRLGAPDRATAALGDLIDGLHPSWLARTVLARADAEAAGDLDALRRLRIELRGRWPLAHAEVLAVMSRLEGGSHDPAAAARSALAAVAAAAELGPVLPGSLRSLPTVLTARELQVAVRVAGGASSRDVAAGSGVSVRTVENQLQSVYRKLELTGRDQLTALLTG